MKENELSLLSSDKYAKESFISGNFKNLPCTVSSWDRIQTENSKRYLLLRKEHRKSPVLNLSLKERFDLEVVETPSKTFLYSKFKSKIENTPKLHSNIYFSTYLSMCFEKTQNTKKHKKQKDKLSNGNFETQKTAFPKPKN
mgnify:CR=1 FL=1